ncbi:MAG TPA: PCP reductase family protein [Gemmatimonadaceae bacterium]|nr:PCP reductase family protein [Gemmatimonadaceae bacterium]
MKFLCVDCDEQMTYETRQEPGDGTFAAAFRCGRCGRRVAMLANPMETQLVAALGVRVGGRPLDEQPLELVRRAVVGRDDAFDDANLNELAPAAAGTRPRWSAASQERLQRVPGFVRGMVMRLYADYARERGIVEITPAVMDRARTELGLEGM